MRSDNCNYWRSHWQLHWDMSGGTPNYRLGSYPRRPSLEFQEFNRQDVKL
ncbi:MAG: hypothetical protein ISS51_02885 [Dehalococcoidales bacterium]|nr:hypothetical protein [Dehalococcoidales bacterium]